MSACRICECTDQDCTWCIALFGNPCFWAEPDLCSACFIQDGLTDAERALLLADECSIQARRRWSRAPVGMALIRRKHFFLCVAKRLTPAVGAASSITHNNAK